MTERDAATLGKAGDGTNGLPRPVIRPATRADLAAFYGPGKLPLTVRAVVGLVDGAVVGCGGISEIDGILVAFSDFRPTARRYKLAIVKAAAAVIAEAQRSGARFIYAEADPHEPGAERWMRALGFRPTGRARFYRWAATEPPSGRLTLI